MGAAEDHRAENGHEGSPTDDDDDEFSRVESFSFVLD